MTTHPGLEAGCPHPARRHAPHWVALAFLLVATVVATALDSEPAPLAAKTLLLDVTKAGQRFIAVGDRGHVLLSDDDGRSWRQVIVPTRAMLTAVAFADATHGWAVGHEGVILETRDAGSTWAVTDFEQNQDTIFLDVLFLDANQGWIVGAYGKCLGTTDGGKTWQAKTPGDEEVHLNALGAASDGVLYVAGEAGTLLTSINQGRRWRQVELPYEGSLFGVLPLGARALLVFGLRGHVYASENGGRNWAARASGVSTLLATGVRLRSGAIVLAGAGGHFALSRDAGRSFGAWQPTEYGGGVAALAEAADGALVVVGELGVARLQLPLK